MARKDGDAVHAAVDVLVWLVIIGGLLFVLLWVWDIVVAALSLVLGEWFHRLFSAKHLIACVTGWMKRVVQRKMKQ